MNEAERKEYEQTRLRVKYNNCWPAEKWISPLQEALQAKMKKAGFNQIFCPLALEDDKAVDALFEDAELNRIVSTLLDLYDELPLRPDAAFDVAWRALEIGITFYFKNFDQQVYKDKNASTEEKIKRVSNAVYESQLTTNATLMGIFNRLIGDNVSWSVLHYIIARMYLPGELQVKTQFEYVSARCRDILGAGMYDDIKGKYVIDNNLTPDNHRKAERLLQIIINGNPVKIVEHPYKALSLQERITFILSGILYSSRCERFHGDFFSPLKSDRSTLGTYYGQYWLLTVSYMFFWMTVHQYLEKKKVEPFFTLEALAESIGKTIDAATAVMIKK